MLFVCNFIRAFQGFEFKHNVLNCNQDELTTVKLGFVYMHNYERKVNRVLVFHLYRIETTTKFIVSGYSHQFYSCTYQ